MVPVHAWQSVTQVGGVCVQICLPPQILNLCPQNFHFDRECEIKSIEVSAYLEQLRQYHHLKLVLSVNIWQKTKSSTMLIKGPYSLRRHLKISISINKSYKSENVKIFGTIKSQLLSACVEGILRCGQTSLSLGGERDPHPSLPDWKSLHEKCGPLPKFLFILLRT